MVLTVLFQKPAVFVFVVAFLLTILAVQLSGTAPSDAVKWGWQSASLPAKIAIGAALLLAGLSLTSTLWALNPDYAFNKASRHLGIMVVGTLLVLMRSSRPERRDDDPTAALILIGFSIVISIMLVIIYLWDIRPAGTYVHFYNRGTVILLFTSFLGLMMLAESNLPRTTKLGVAAALLAPLCWLLVLTDSQSSQIAAVVLLFTTPVVFWLSKKSHSSVNRSLLVGAGFVVIAAIVAAFATGIIDRLAARAHSFERFEMWVAFTDVAWVKPVMGWGLGAARFITEEMMAELYPNLANQWLFYPHPHNVFVQTFLEFGMIGLALVAVALVAYALATLWYPTERMLWILPLSAAILVVWAVSHGAWQSWWIANLFLIANVFPARTRST